MGREEEEGSKRFKETKKSKKEFRGIYIYLLSDKMSEHRNESFLSHFIQKQYFYWLPQGSYISRLMFYLRTHTRKIYP